MNYFPPPTTLEKLYQQVKKFFPIHNLQQINLQKTITSLVEHTQDISPQSCFVARVRATSDGHAYIPKAIEQGATTIIGQMTWKQLENTHPQLKKHKNILYLQVPDSAQAQAWLATAWFNFPSQKLIVIGITGTDGKTTSANITYQLLKQAGLKTGLLSTINAQIGDNEQETGLHVTTPEAPKVQYYLDQMVKAGLTHCILETTSLGLIQHRITGVQYDIAAITNLTPEHLDYHKTMESYAQSKGLLFDNLSNSGLPPKQTIIPKTSIINAEQKQAQYFSSFPADQTFLYQLSAPAKPIVTTNPTTTITATDIQLHPDHSSFTINNQGQSLPIKTTLLGRFNIYNSLLAYSIAQSLNISDHNIQKTFRNLPTFNGRMQRINQGQSFTVIVDFAHTPNGLQEALQAAKNLTTGKIIVVFGSAGKRDQLKRSTMGKIAASLADIIILTAEDPRNETVEKITGEIIQGIQETSNNKPIYSIPDRGQAIYKACQLAYPQDLVIICGKGHEKSLCFDQTEYPWDDQEAARLAINSLQQKQPMPDLGLPTFDSKTKNFSPLTQNFPLPISQK